MSELFIKSQYLIHQITDQFFKDKTSIPISNVQTDTNELSDEDSVTSEASNQDLETNGSEDDGDDNIENATFHFLETGESGLNYIFDICDGENDLLREYTIYVCGYKTVITDIHPFLQYRLEKQGDVMKFPSFQFKCATNIQVDEDEDYSPKHVYFQNECSKFILQTASPMDEHAIDTMYKGYIQSKQSDNNIYVFFDLTNFNTGGLMDATKRPVADVERTNMGEKTSVQDESEIKVKRTDMFTMCIMDEIINKHQYELTSIDPSVYQIFYQIPTAMTIKDQWGKRIPLPVVLYPCTLSETGYTNTYKEEDVQDSISLISDRVNDDTLGNIHVFSTRPLNESDEKRIQLNRCAVFCINPLYVLHTMKKNEPDDEGFRLSSIIPNAISYLSTKPDDSKGDDATLSVDEVGDDEEEVGDDEEGEEEVGDDEEGEEEDDRKILIEQMDNITQHAFSSIYFQEMVNDQKHTFWGIKSSTQFTPL
jgi:hypothetical protein